MPFRGWGSLPFRNFSSTGFRRLLLVFGLLASIAGSIYAETVIDVYSGADDGVDSLRTAINAANAGSGDYRIVVHGDAAPYAMFGNGDDSNATGDFDIATAGRRLTIVGQQTILGQWTFDPIVDAAQADRIFHVRSGSLVLDNLRLRNGRAIDNGHGSANGYGGGILIESGAQVTLSNVSIQTCSAQAGHTFGGGIFVFGGAAVTIEGGDLTGNYAEGHNGVDGTPPGGAGGAGCEASGGGLFIDIGATATVNRCTISGNWVRGGAGGSGAQGRGGSIYEDPTAGGNGGAGGAGYGAFARVASTGVLVGDNVTLSGNTCYGGAGGNGGNSGIALGGWQVAGGNGGAGGNAYGSSRGIHISAGATVRLGGFGANTDVGGVGGLGGTGTPMGVTGSTGSYVPCDLKCLDVSVYRSADEAGTVAAWLGDLRVDLLATNGALLCCDLSRPSSALSYNAGLCHTFTAAVVQVAELPEGYRRGANPPSDFGRYDGKSGTLNGSALLRDPMYNVPIYVSPSGGNQYPYCSWGSAAPTITHGLSGAIGTTGSVLLLAAATHTQAGALVISQPLTIRGDGNNPAKVIVRETFLNVRPFLVSNANARLEGLSITGGQTPTDGGAVWLYAGSMDRCLITGNSAARNGGGIFVSGGGTVRNTLIYSNTCSQRGGGIALNGAGTVENCTVYGNSAGISGGGIYCETNGTIRNDIAWNNAAPDSPDWNVSAYAYADYCCTKPLLGAHSTTSAPEFAAPGTLDFRLRPGSPGLDAGLAQSWMTSADDFRGRTRVSGASPDMGAFESRYVTITASANSTNGTISPSGAVSCLELDGAVFDIESITPGWAILNLIVDGELVGPTNFYAFNGVLGSHTIVANFGRAIHVSHDGSAVFPYATWATAARSLEQATSAVMGASVILITNGTYAVSNEIVLAADVTVCGVNGARNTTLLGQGPVRILNVQDPDVLINGLTITGGAASPSELYQTGAVYLDGNGTIQDCILTGNLHTAVMLRNGGLARRCLLAGNRAGAGLCCNHGELRDSIVTGNRECGVRGECLDWYPTIQNCTIVSNRGAGVKMIGGTLRNCLIAYNVNTQGVGGIELPTMGLVRADYINCVIANNTGTNVGGAYAVGANFINCTVANNYGAAVGGIQTMMCRLLNVIAYSNRNSGMTAEANMSLYGTAADNCGTTPAQGNNCVTSWPRFANPAGGDYRLMSGSPCIDAGGASQSMAMQDTLYAPGNDLAGAARPRDGDGNGAAVVDIGAYEFVSPAWDTDGDGIPDVWEIAKKLNPTDWTDAPADSDDDGDINTSEYIADTDPYDGDPFHIRDVRRTNTCAVGFIGSTERIYTLYACTNIDQDAWQPVNGCIGRWGLGANTMLIDTNSARHMNYHVRVSLP
jgi:hypothetical protein